MAPNVKLMGFGDIRDGNADGDEAKIKRLIQERLPELASEAVVTIVSSETKEVASDKPAPYLEIASSDPGHTLKLVRLLQPLGYDIETASIGFYPAQPQPPE